MELFTGTDIGGFLARRLLPAAVLVPLVLGWLRLAGESAGLYGTAFGTSLLVVATIVAFTALIGWNAAVLRRLDLERIRAVGKLRESEERLARAQRIARIGNWDWNIATNELVWSDEVYRIFGLEPGQIRATYPEFLSHVHREDRERVDRAVDRAVRAGEPYSLDHRIVRPSGEVRFVHEEGEVTRDAAGRPIRMLGTVQDITERRRAEDELRESEERFRLLFRDAGMGIALVDPEGRILTSNPALQRFLGYPGDRLAGRHFREVTYPEDVDTDWRLFQELVAGKRRSYQIEKRYFRAARTAAWSGGASPRRSSGTPRAAPVTPSAWSRTSPGASGWRRSGGV